MYFGHKIINEVRQSYNAIAKEFDQTRRLPWKEFALFLPYLKKGMRILDVGCGNGRLYEYLQRREIEYQGIDISKALIKIARTRHPSVGFDVQDITSLKPSAKPFDVILCIATLHHIPSSKLRKKALKNMEDCLKEGGILIVSVWNLWQKDFWRSWLKSIVISLMTLGLARSYKDLWLRWGKGKIKRYFHAFSKTELTKLFDQKKWHIEKMLFTQNGNPVEHHKAHNMMIIVRKKV